MITVQIAEIKHVKAIVNVCIEAQWATYKELYSKEYIEQIISEYYNEERVYKEVTETGRGWGGWFVALDGEEVVGAGGGGMTGAREAEIYVLYLKPTRRNEGIGSKLLHAITLQQQELGATIQWVSVAKDNQKAIPFYEAKGFRFQHEEEAYEKGVHEDYISLRYAREVGK